MTDALQTILQQIRACRHCASELPLGPRPIIRASGTASLLIIGQVPGTRVHQSGTPWDDPSGDRLRAWTQLDKSLFYDDTKVAIMPMGFCYPGRDKNGGDAPPRPECAPLWHEQVLGKLPSIKLTLLVGSYAQKHYLGPLRKRTMTETVASWTDYLPMHFVLPHPSWRNTGWMKRNPWFERDLLPDLHHRMTLLDI